MKKRYSLLLIILGIVLITISLVSFVSSLNIYTINEDVCRHIFVMKSPQEFCDSEGEGTYLTDYIFAKVDKNGNLLLILTDRQLDKWISSSHDLIAVDIVTGGRTGLFKNYEINMDDKVESALFYDFKEETVIVSEDYKKITIKYGCMHEIIFSFYRITNGCVHMQLLNGVPSDDITLQLVVVNENGEIVTDLTWPKETLVYERTFIR
ncbi:MAG: hypothetical protein E7679_07000 [Ruminococcaceae bacterium]|nr:hypothetical protein [Oscillospiraceae bacterium]